MADLPADEIDSLTIERLVPPKRGGWRIIPKDQQTAKAAESPSISWRLGAGTFTLHPDIALSVVVYTRLAAVGELRPLTSKPGSVCPRAGAALSTRATTFPTTLFSG